MTTAMARAGRWFYAKAYLLLIATALMWGGNAVVSRVAVNDVSPMMLTFLRWSIACTLLLLFMHKQISIDWPIILKHWKLVGVMGAIGFTCYNGIFYVAAHHTTALNMTILQGAIPLYVLVGSVIVFGNRLSGQQILGSFIAFLGILTVAAQGDLVRLKDLSLNIGDVYMIVACLFYAGYTLALRYRPQTSGIAFFTGVALAAFITSIPVVGYEILTQTVQWPTARGWWIVLFVGIFPSLLSQIFFMRGVELIGAARAGIFINLVPVFGALMAVLLLGEPFGLYHAVSLALVLGGIWITERA
jgi:drug/metabolite transporter (DMT)-like permease